MVCSLASGCSADVCVWDWATGPVAQRRMDVAHGLHERVFAWMTLADERNLVAAFVAGASRYQRDAAQRREETSTCFDSN